MSSRDGTMPEGWAISAPTGITIAGASERTLYAVRVSTPNEAQTIALSHLPQFSTDQIRVVGTLTKATLDKFGIKPGEIGGPL